MLHCKRDEIRCSDGRLGIVQSRRRCLDDLEQTAHIVGLDGRSARVHDLRLVLAHCSTKHRISKQSHKKKYEFVNYKKVESGHGTFYKKN